MEELWYLQGRRRSEQYPSRKAAGHKQMECFFQSGGILKVYSLYFLFNGTNHQFGAWWPWDSWRVQTSTSLTFYFSPLGVSRDCLFPILMLKFWKFHTYSCEVGCLWKCFKRTEKYVLWFINCYRNTSTKTKWQKFWAEWNIHLVDSSWVEGGRWRQWVTERLVVFARG